MTSEKLKPKKQATQSPFRTREFKKLFQKWNERLIASNHDEIEDFSVDIPIPKQWALRYANMDREAFKAKEQYYRLARGFLFQHIFKNKVHYRIWELHTEGVPIREIANILGMKKLRKSMVSRIVLEIRKELKKSWK